MSKHQASRHPLRIALTCLALAGSAETTLAADPPASPPAVSKETREKMAVLHEQMAACLRSDKSMTECRNEMRKSCQQTMGDQGCSMMGGGMHHGMGMGGPPSSAAPKK